jgi:hypothetical protein
VAVAGPGREHQRRLFVEEFLAVRVVVKREAGQREACRPIRLARREPLGEQRHEGVAAAPSVPEDAGERRQAERRAEAVEGRRNGSIDHESICRPPDRTLAPRRKKTRVDDSRQDGRLVCALQDGGGEQHRRHLSSQALLGGTRAERQRVGGDERVTICRAQLVDGTDQRRRVAHHLLEPAHPVHEVGAVEEAQVVVLVAQRLEVEAGPPHQWLEVPIGRNAGAVAARPQRTAEPAQRQDVAR